MVNIGEITKPSGGVSPLKSDRSSSAANKIDPADSSKRVDDAEDSTGEKHSRENPVKTSKEKAKKTSDDADKEALEYSVYDEKGHQVSGKNINISV